MSQDDWPALRLFAAVAEAHSFTRAAADVGVTPSALSHAIRKLEARLGVQLFHRTTRSVATTAEGERLLIEIQPALSAVRAAVESLNQVRPRPAGRVRISAHRPAVGNTVLPRMVSFAEAYPDIEVEVVADDAMIDIVANRFDAGIRHGHLLDRDMVSIRIGTPDRIAVVASPDYLARHPAPETPADLSKHRCIHYRYRSSGRLHRWQFEKKGRPLPPMDLPGALVLGDIDLLMEAATLGVGVASVSEKRARPLIERGALVGLLEAWCPGLPADHLYYPAHRGTTAALRAFIDHVKSPSSAGF